jgi:hypothetical protein
MAQFSRTTAQIDALLDELISARGGYATLSAALSAKASNDDLAAVSAETAKKMSATCDIEITSGDVDNVCNAGSYYFSADSIPNIDNLPTGLSVASRLEVVDLPCDLRQQIIRTSSSIPALFVRNSTSEPEPTTDTLIPAMTSATTPSGEVIESGHYGDRYGYQAFDGVDSQTWMSHSWSDGTNELDGTPDKCYVGYIWDTPQVVSSVKISFSSDVAYTGCIQCKVNDVWQTVISSITIASTGYTGVEQSLVSPVECTAIRFCVLSGDQERFCSSNYGGNVCEMIVYGTGGLTATWGDWYSVGMSVVQ